MARVQRKLSRSKNTSTRPHQFILYSCYNSLYVLSIILKIHTIRSIHSLFRYSLQCFLNFRETITRANLLHVNYSSIRNHINIIFTTRLHNFTSMAVRISISRYLRIHLLIYLMYSKPLWNWSVVARPSANSQTKFPTAQGETLLPKTPPIYLPANQMTRGQYLRV